MQGQISLIKGILILVQAQRPRNQWRSTNCDGFCAKLTHETNTNVTSKNASLAILSYFQKQRKNNHKDFQLVLFACFLSQHEPKKISEALEDESWVDAMQEELLQFEIQNVWILVDLPYGKKAIGTKWVYRNKKDERKLEAIRNYLAIDSYWALESTNGREKWPFHYARLMKRPDIMFASVLVLVSSHSKDSHLSAVKRIFYVPKGKPKLAFGDSLLGNAKANHFATSTTEAVYVAAASSCGQLEVMLVNALRRFRESLRRVTDGAEAFLILTLFILCLDKVSTDHAKLVPLGKVCTAKETLEKNTAKGTKCKLEPLISLTDDLSLLSNMAALESCPKHNMIAYLEKTEGNVEFHEVINFLRRSYIYHALTVSPVVLTTFIEQFWTSAKSKTINNVRHITARVAGKFVSISEASIQTDLIFNNADGIDSLPNQAIFDAIQLMGYEGDLTVLTFNKALFSPQWSHCPTLSSAQSSEVPFEQQPDLSPSPSPRPSPNPSPTPIIPDSIPEPTDQAKEIELLKAKIKRLKKKATPVINHFKAYQKRISKEQRQQRKRSSKKKRVQKESVSKQGRKNAKGDGKAKENAQSKGRTKEMMDEDKETDEVGLSTEDEVSTAKEGVSTDFEKVSTDRPKLSTDDLKVSTDEQMESNDDQVDASEEIFEGTKEQGEGTEEKVESTAEQKESTEEQTKEEIATQASQTSTQTPSSMIFGDDETIATLLINMSKAKTASKEKEKGIELKDVEDTDRPRPTSTRSTLTLKPLPKIDPKDKGKKKIEEEDETESEDDDIPQAVKKFKQLESDEELARKVQEEWEAEEERNKIAEEQATNEALIQDFDDIKARIEARPEFSSQKKDLAQQRSQAIRNKPPTKNQLRNQMITYLKHVGNFKHANLKGRKFEDIQALYEKIKRLNEHFISTGSAKDERLVKNTIRKRGVYLNLKAQVKKKKWTMNTCKKYPIIDWKTQNYGTKPQLDEAKTNKEINLNVVTRSNGQKRHFSVLTSVLSIFDREDLNAVYQLVMNKYQDEMPEGFERVLWGEFKCSSGVHTLMTNEGVVIHMLTEKKYPLKKEILVQMLNLRLESEEESTMALELIRFIKKVLADLESKEQD
ncbi:hypothetical protein Tco_1338101 [Tanacetum coccineum]